MSACTARGTCDGVRPDLVTELGLRSNLRSWSRHERHHAARMLLAAAFACPLLTYAATLVVQPGQSIAAAVQAAHAGDKIVVQPGVYHEGAAGDLNALTITKDGIEIAGAPTADSPVVLENAGGQSYGIWISPADTTGAAAEGDDENPPCGLSGTMLKQFTLSGITVRGFANHGVHLACVDGFSLAGNVSDSNTVYGLFPIRSHHGVISGNEVTGTTNDAAVYVGQSDNVAVSNNNVHDSLLGIEVQNSQYCSVTGNDVHDNTLGILVDVEEGHVVKIQQSTTVGSNQVHDNNRANSAEPGSIIAVLPPGIGILLVGPDGSVVTQNTVVSNRFAGIGVVSLCLALTLDGAPCSGIDVEPNPDGNRIENNIAQNNGTIAVGNQLDALRADLVWDGSGTGNCWTANTFGTAVPSNGFGTGSALPDCNANPSLVTAPALSAPGTITYDALGMPTIQASTDADVAFLQGYAQAQVRFFEMDFDRRAASGTLAELVGQAALASDVQTRTLGLRRAAFATWAALDDDTKGWLQAYANGVNLWLQTQALPLEYGALQLTRAEPWSPVDSITVGKGLAFQLSFDLDIQNTIDYAAYSQAAAAANVDVNLLFFGDTHRFAPPDDRVTVPGFQPSPLVQPQSSTNVPNGGIRIDPQALSLAKAYRDQIAGNPFIAPTLRPRHGRGGSNEWAVSGSVTASGKPLIANDPHLTLALPPIFMEMHIISSDAKYPQPLNATGVSVPGTPGIIQGCNSNICWGSTVNPMDVTDTFLETFLVDSYGLPTAIVHNGVAEPVDWAFQSFYVNTMTPGATDSIVRDNSIGYTNGALTVTVPRRNNGPVVQIGAPGTCALTGQDSIPPAYACGLSIAYTGWGATFELKAFKLINRAQNIDDFQNALTFFDFGSQNFAYADTAGNIAYFTSAENPIRDDLQNFGQYIGTPPFFIRDGSGQAHNDWLPVQNPQPNQAIPFEIMPASEMPHVINPSAGYVANANNDPIGVTLDNNPFNQLRPNGGIYYLNYGYDAYRMGRIDRLLSSLIASGQKVTMSDIEHVQLNTQPVDAELVLPYLLGAYQNAAASGAWPPLAALAADPQVSEAVARLSAWDLSTPTGLAQGYDAGDVPLVLKTPTPAQLDNSVAATEFFMWRSNAIKNTVDATLTAYGLGNYLPGDNIAYTSLKFLLDAFPVLSGHGASGINFFNVPGAPDPASARDFLLLKSLQDGLNQLAGDSFSAAFGNSTDQSGYHWGALHRFVLEHPLGGPFNIPGPNPYPFTDLGPGLPGLARDSAFETVNPGGGTLRVSGVNDFMFSGATAPGRRFVGEMDMPISAVEVIPGGESAVLGDPNYVSQLPLWLTGNYHLLIVDPAAAVQAGQTTLHFQP